MVFFLEIEFLNFSSIIGITEEMREEYRQRVLDTTKEVFFFQNLSYSIYKELVDAANKYLLDKIKEGKTSQVIFGSQSNDLEGLLSRGNHNFIIKFLIQCRLEN